MDVGPRGRIQHPAFILPRSNFSVVKERRPVDDTDVCDILLFVQCKVKGVLCGAVGEVLLIFVCFGLRSCLASGSALLHPGL